MSAGRVGPPQTETGFPPHAAVGPGILKRIWVLSRLHAKKALTSGRRKGIGAKYPQCPRQAGHHVSSLHKAILGLQQAVPAPAGSRGPKKTETTRTHRVKMSRNPSDVGESRTTSFAKKSALFPVFFPHRVHCQPLHMHCSRTTRVMPGWGRCRAAHALPGARAPGGAISPEKIISTARAHPNPARERRWDIRRPDGQVIFSKS